MPQRSRDPPSNVTSSQIFPIPSALAGARVTAEPARESFALLEGWFANTWPLNGDGFHFWYSLNFYQCLFQISLQPEGKCFPTLKKKILKKLEIMVFLPLFLHNRQDFRQDFRLTTLSICCFDAVSSTAIPSNSLFLHSFLSFLEISIVKSDF